MSRRYVAVGPVSREPLSYGGMILVHEDRAELEFLLPGTQVVEIGDQIPWSDTMPIRQHPELSKVEWPLRREDFR